MSGYWPSNEKVSSRVNPAITSGPPTGPAENYAAAREDQKFNQNPYSQFNNLSAAYSERQREIYQITGKRLSNPMEGVAYSKAEAIEAAVVGPSFSRKKQIEEFEREVSILRQQYPQLMSQEQMMELLSNQASIIDQRARNVSDRATTLGTIGEFAGAMQGSLEDPFTFASLFAGGPKQASILRTALQEAALAGGSEVVAQPQIQDFREDKGLEAGLVPGAQNVGFAALGGGVIGGGVAAAETLAGKALIKRFDEKIKNPTPEQKTARDILEQITELQSDNPLSSAIPASSEEHMSRLIKSLEAIDENQLDRADLPFVPVSEKALHLTPDNLDGVINSFNPSDIEVDAKTFQFKEGGDAAGVTERLRDVKEWDPVKAGNVLVYEYQDGRKFIADGHQRLGLAKRIQDITPDQNIRLYGHLFKEADGFTPETVRVIAAMKNIAEGTGTAVDAAKVLRVAPERINELPPRSQLVKQASDMMDLSDDAFGLVINDVVDANQAAIVGRLVKDPDTQMAIMDILAKTEPANIVQAEAIIRQAMDAGIVKETQIGLFGEETMAKSMFLERAKILDKGLKKLRQDAKVFDTLVRNEQRIAAEGNVLSTAANEARAATDARAAQMIQMLASRKGPLSDALTAAARRAVDEGKYSDATADFVDAVRSAIERGDFDRLPDGQSGRLNEASGQNTPQPAASNGISEESLSLFSEPGGRGSELQAKALEADIRDLTRSATQTPIIDKTLLGDQTVLPGAEKISDRELVERLIDRKLTATETQQAMDIGLFDDVGRAQQDLLDMPIPVGERIDVETGGIIPEVKTVKEILEDLDRDAADLDAIGKCGMP